jgi:putative tributyrin esterase
MSGLSSVTDLSQLAGLVQEDHSSLGIPASDRSLKEVIRGSRNIRPFRFDCGREDFLIDANRGLHRDLTEAGVPHQYEESAGIHDWAYWRTSLEATLRFFASHC